MGVSNRGAGWYNFRVVWGAGLILSLAVPTPRAQFMLPRRYPTLSTTKAVPPWDKDLVHIDVFGSTIGLSEAIASCSAHRPLGAALIRVMHKAWN
jgi:hypothetical protein